ncbi:MAG: carbohydrate binding family 9 domain-containing protein, partial [candidate division Zixibacteria bacterium]|nr:carbohydrate binding family 9 domain-containing protein [candidate division Zixibacteria bacterium]
MKVRSLTRLLVTVMFVVVAVSSAGAQDKQTTSQKKRKEMTAVRVPNGSIDIDGRLDDAAWKQAKFVADFLQVLPVEYGEPSNATEVAIVYDDEAVYIGARMYVDDPENLRKDLSRRDDRGLGEQIIITLDTYLDRRTSYGFGVTTAGVRFDRYSSDDTQHSDFSWDAVWEVRTSVDDKSWLAEFRIPISQLRFNNTDVQTWGININRWIPYTTEDVFWVPVLPSETGWASRFGNLVGIEGIKPSRRLELMPYAASDGQFTNNYSPGDPYDDGSVFKGRLGGDLKMGLGPNLTLDATFNPDFGQVEADPAVVNLSAYETFFAEKRPFFTEGSDLFSAIGPNWFYSRRIGARPHGEADGDFVKYPSNTTILGAAKVTGRLKSGTSIGGLIAVTDAEEAEVHNLYSEDTTYNVDSTIAGIDTSFAETHSTKVEPRTIHGVIRVKKDLGEGGSTAGLILTGLARDMDDADPLAELLTKQAFSGGLDWLLQFKDRTYALYGNAGFSTIRGSKNAILGRQLNSAHYFQRPDADHVEVGYDRESLTGSIFSLGFEKNGGEHWLWEIGAAVESPDL